MIIFPSLALGLAAMGILSLVVMKIAAARRTRLIINHSEPDRVDDQSQHERRDDQDQHGIVDERHLLISAVSDYGPMQAEGGTLPGNLTEISQRKDKLAQLRQHLDRLLQSSAVPRDEPQLGQTVAC